MKNDNEILGAKPETPNQPTVDENALMLDVLKAQPPVEETFHDAPEYGKSDAKESEGQFETLYHLELFAHNQTKAALKEAQAFMKRANEMGFTGGGGIHKGA